MNKDSILLLKGLKVTREQLLSLISQISDEDLFRSYNGSLTIAHYLLHIAQKELWWQRTIVQGVSLTEEEKERYYISDEHSLPVNQGKSWYLARLAEARVLTRDYFLKLSDVDYHRAQCKIQLDGEVKVYSPEWILYHLIDQESYYRGQIAMLLSMKRDKKVDPFLDNYAKLP